MHWFTQYSQQPILFKFSTLVAGTQVTKAVSATFLGTVSGRESEMEQPALELVLCYATH